MQLFQFIYFFITSGAITFLFSDEGIYCGEQFCTHSLSCWSHGRRMMWDPLSRREHSCEEKVEWQCSDRCDWMSGETWALPGPASLFAPSVPHFHFPGCTAELRGCKLCFESCWVLPTKCIQEWRILHTRSADVLYYMYHLSVGSDKLNATATHITQIPSKNQFLALHDCSF